MELSELVKRLDVMEGVKVSNIIKNTGLGARTITIIAGEEAHEVLTMQVETDEEENKIDNTRTELNVKIRCGNDICRGVYCKDVELLADAKTGVSIKGACPECGKISTYYLTTSSIIC